MIVKWATTALSLVALLSFAAGASAQPRYKLDKTRTKVVALSGLGSGDPCLPDRLSGRIASVQYAANGVALESFALEGKDGSRDLINVDLENIRSADMVTIGYVAQGLEHFIRKGKRVTIGVLLCGAAGRVIMLDSVGGK